MKKFFNGILAFLGLVRDKVSAKFKKLYDMASPQGKVAVDLVNKVKELVESPLATTLVSLTPSSKDDELLAKAKNILGIAAGYVIDANNIINDGDRKKVVERLIEYLRGITKSERAKFYVDLGGKLTEMLADGKINLAEAISLSQFIYNEGKKGN